ncbi:MAG TPA: TMEM175 family protein, partial [Ktedonobacterales bacterium]|nr:TMEM175 family protein [Ktedonobacterales bacterium]
IFAVAITLLVLEVKLPTGTTNLESQVLAQWPSFLAYFISFMTILIMWLNHHSIFKLVHRTDHTFMVINGLLMLLITFVNYPTAVLADSLQSHVPGSSDQVFAAAFYSVTFVVISIVFQAVWLYATYKRRLLSKRADPALVAAITTQYRFGPLFYVAAFALAFVNIWASVAVNGGLAVYFAFTGQMTQLPGRNTQKNPEASKTSSEADHSSEEAAG